MKRFSYENLLVWLLVIGSIAYVHRNWFIAPEIIGGDWPYYYNEFFSDISIHPVLWPSWLGNGMGAVNPLLGLGLFFSLLLVPFTQWAHISWPVVYKIGWFGFFLAASILSSRALLKTVTSHISEGVVALGALIYTTNTYALMLTGGGQMGIALAYGLAPLALSLWIRMINDDKKIMKGGASLAIILMLDPRIAYITLFAIGLYILVSRKCTTQVIFSCVGAGLVTLFLNAFWILPMIVLRSNPLDALGSAFTSREAVKFFSFADFSHALSLLHPNWPENIFGKTRFLQPEFLVSPAIAFTGLLFINGTKYRLTVLYFSLLALVGAFLAKGMQEPFGGIYVWFFEHAPGFIMFRDPTKFYLFGAISYSVLIPYVIDKIGKFTTLFAVVFIISWCITIRQALTGELGGTFIRHIVPNEYKELQLALETDTQFARTLWVPRQQRFAFASFDHMPVEAATLFQATSPAELRDKMFTQEAQTLVNDMGIGYVMVPYDSLGELFIKDRTYDAALRSEYEDVLDGIPWLTKVSSGAIALYKTQRHRDLFSLSDGTPVTYERHRYQGYRVYFEIDKSTELIFSQNYHPGWTFVHSSGKIKAQKTDSGLIVFPLVTADTYTGTVLFEPQKYVEWGMIVSLVICIAIIVVSSVFGIV